jgi:hypothetical protein
VATQSRNGGWLRRLLRSDEQEEAQVLSERSTGSGADPIAACERGAVVRICGTIRSLAIRPRSSAPALTAEVYDGSGHITLVWLGRRRIPGIDVGRTIVAEGRLTCPDGDPMIYNPSYTLTPLART